MDWIALVSVVTSAAVGVAGVWAGRVNARETRESAERTAREQHERRIASPEIPSTSGGARTSPAICTCSWFESVGG